MGSQRETWTNSRRFFKHATDFCGGEYVWLRATRRSQQMTVRDFCFRQTRLEVSQETPCEAEPCSLSGAPQEPDVLQARSTASWARIGFPS